MTTLPNPPNEYDQAYMRDLVSKIEEELRNRHKKGEDIVVGQGRDNQGALVSRRLILRDEATGDRYRIRSNGGVIDIEGPL